MYMYIYKERGSDGGREGHSQAHRLTETGGERGRGEGGWAGGRERSGRRMFPNEH